jgi:hypothetical protein
MLQTISHLSRAELILIIEAWLLIMVAAFAVRFFKFQTLRKIASRPLRPKPETKAAAETLLPKVRSAVAIAARRSPFRSLCFEQGLTAQLMLRRRGINSILFYGLNSSAEKTLGAHVWVMVDDFPICGERLAGNFAVMITMPADG